MLSAWARSAEPDGVVAALDAALYEQRSLLRMHCMRRTLFVVPDELAADLQASTTRVVSARERASVLKLLAATGPHRDEAWLAEAEDAALKVLARLGTAAASEITAEVPVLQETVTMSPGKPYEAVSRVGGHVLRLLAMDGRVRRARPVGGWTSGQFTYEIAPPLRDADPAAAQAEIVRRWLACYGPAATEDVKWWTGWTLGAARKALAEVGAVAVELDEGPGWVLPGDEAETGDVEPWAALLPSLDPATMGWKHRDWYMAPELRPLLFDTAGNGGPTVWWDGEIVGTWAQRDSGEVVWRMLADRGAGAEAAVAAEAARLEAWLADRRLRIKFAAPLTRELLS
ncbi:winged helix DNA-binding domain-containing protein [Yinghuangia soli]|uniref:winged helix DNA-binding domain-containing protein n=1 Tax=Yinghuangia soli TaxID=2908204 RepID=UPI0027E23B2A|nr:winged helix DNA-binding domain-containing protein [Yinghuangia soli]